MLWTYWHGFLQVSKNFYQAGRRIIKDECEHWTSVAHDIRWFGKDDTSEWPLVTAVPARQSLAPRSVNRMREKAKVKR